MSWTKETRAYKQSTKNDTFYLKQDQLSTICGHFQLQHIQKFENRILYNNVHWIVILIISHYLIKKIKLSSNWSLM